MEKVEEDIEPGSAKLILTLGIAGFLSGLILVAVYLYTKPIIANNKAEALKLAVFEVLPGTDTFETMYFNGSEITAVPNEKADGAEMIYFGYNVKSEFTGIAIAGEEGGYQDIITALYGYNPDDKLVIGLKVLDSKETPGLGDKIIKDADFLANFNALAVEPEIILIKKGEKSKDNEVEAITGATISSRAIAGLLQKSMTKWKGPIDKYLKENNIRRASVKNDDISEQ